MQFDGGAGGRRGGDGGVRVRRAGAVRHRPDQRRASRGSRRARSRRSRSSRCGSDARDRSGAAGAAGRRRDAALPLLAGASGATASVFGFTDHDQDVSFDGVVFRASSGMDASALQSATGLSVDNAPGGRGAERRGDQRGGHPGRAVTTGREIRHWLVDWERPDLRVLLFRGHVRRDPPGGRRVRGRAARAGRGAERAGRAVGPADLRPGARATRNAGSTRPAGVLGRGRGRRRASAGGGLVAARARRASPTAGSRTGR